MGIFENHTLFRNAAFDVLISPHEYYAWQAVHRALPKESTYEEFFKAASEKMGISSHEVEYIFSNLNELSGFQDSTECTLLLLNNLKLIDGDTHNAFNEHLTDAFSSQKNRGALLEKYGSEKYGSKNPERSIDIMDLYDIAGLMKVCEIPLIGASDFGQGAFEGLAPDQFNQLIDVCENLNLALVEPETKISLAMQPVKKFRNTPQIRDGFLAAAVILKRAGYQVEDAGVALKTEAQAAITEVFMRPQKDFDVPDASYRLTPHEYDQAYKILRAGKLISRVAQRALRPRMGS